MLAREIEWINKQTDKEQANIQQLINNYIEQQHLLGSGVRIAIESR
jgi:hypothetical protein